MASNILCADSTIYLDITQQKPKLISNFFNIERLRNWISVDNDLEYNEMQSAF